MLEDILNYIKIDETLATAGQPTAKQFKTIAQNGFEVVINLATHKMSRGALKEEDKIVSKNGMVYYHIPINWETPELDRLELFLHTLKMLQKQNKKVFIHCIKNYRASVFIHRYKKDILKQKDVKFIAPKEYVPNATWGKILYNRK